TADKPTADETFATAIKKSGDVLLGADLIVTVLAGGRAEHFEPPYKPLRQVAAGVGHVLSYVDADAVIRQASPSSEELPGLSWATTGWHVFPWAPKSRSWCCSALCLVTACCNFVRFPPS